MKTGIINTKEWDLSECMNPKRFIEYTEDDFKEIETLSDIEKLCSNIRWCKVKKCNLKKALKKYSNVICENIMNRKREELKKHMERINKIIGG